MSKRADAPTDTIELTIRIDAKTAQVPGAYPLSGTKPHLLASIFSRIEIGAPHYSQSTACDEKPYAVRKLWLILLASTEHKTKLKTGDRETTSWLKPSKPSLANLWTKQRFRHCIKKSSA
jgi:hypothetical protein